MAYSGVKEVVQVRRKEKFLAAFVVFCQTPNVINRRSPR